MHADGSMVDLTIWLIDQQRQRGCKNRRLEMNVLSSSKGRLETCSVCVESWFARWATRRRAGRLLGLDGWPPFGNRLNGNLQGAPCKTQATTPSDHHRPPAVNPNIVIEKRPSRRKSSQREMNARAEKYTTIQESTSPNDFPTLLSLLKTTAGRINIKV